MSNLINIDEGTYQESASILKKPYIRRLRPDESGGYTASIQEFPGLIAEGETPEEALSNLERSAESWITISMLNGREIRDPVDFDGCSGKIALRIPKSLHMQAAELAELEGTSLNQVLTMAISSYVSARNLLLDSENSIKKAIFNYLQVTQIFNAYSNEPRLTSKQFRSGFDNIKIVNGTINMHEEKLTKSNYILGVQNG